MKSGLPHWRRNKSMGDSVLTVLLAPVYGLGWVVAKVGFLIVFVLAAGIAGFKRGRGLPEVRNVA